MSLSAADILAIPESRAAVLFRDADYHDLAKRWHPDRHGGNLDVFAHINRLKDALDQQAADREVILPAKTGGKSYRLLVRRRHPFELGEVLIGHTIVAYHIKQDYGDLAQAGLRAMNSISYPDQRMQDDLSRFFPKEKGYKETENGILLIIEKTSDVVMLRDLIDHCGGALDPKHVCWIISSLLNLSCFLSCVLRICHNGLTTESVFVSPQHHSVCLFGGWWYTVRLGGRIKYLPPGVHAVTPAEVLRSKTADPRIDLESIRAIGRACLGGHAGVAALPRPYANFLRLPAPESPIDDYARWEQVREDSYGPRRFLAMNIAGPDVYP